MTVAAYTDDALVAKIPEALRRAAVAAWRGFAQLSVSFGWNGRVPPSFTKLHEAEQAEQRVRLLERTAGAKLRRVDGVAAVSERQEGEHGWGIGPARGR